MIETIKNGKNLFFINKNKTYFPQSSVSFQSSPPNEYMFGSTLACVVDQ